MRRLQGGPEQREDTGDLRGYYGGLAGHFLEFYQQQGAGVIPGQGGAEGYGEVLQEVYPHGLQAVWPIEGADALDPNAEGPRPPGPLPRRTAFEAHGLVDAHTAWQAVCTQRLAPEVYALVAELDTLQVQLQQNLQMQQMLTYIPPRRQRRRGNPVPILQRPGSRWFGIPKAQPRARRAAAQPEPDPDPDPESDGGQ